MMIAGGRFFCVFMAVTLALLALPQAAAPAQKMAEPASSEQPSLTSIESYAGRLKADRAQESFNKGMAQYRQFDSIKINHPHNERVQKNRIQSKINALDSLSKTFARAERQGHGDWVILSAYMTGRAHYDMAEAVKNQTLFGGWDGRLAGKLVALLESGKYYDQAIKHFSRNVTFANRHGLTGEYVEASKLALMETVFKNGYDMEEIGLIIKDAPLPSIHCEDEREYLIMELEERYLEYLRAAAAQYEKGLALAQEYGVNNARVDAVRDRLSRIR